jgi:protein SCO1/2
MKSVTILLIICLTLFGCTSKNNRLPILGNPTIVGNDTVYPTIPAFKFINQDSKQITNKTFDGKIYIADFIFLNCPTICPKMTNEMTKVYEAYKSNPNILFISHTIDPEHDSIPRLKSYAENLGADPKKWFFVTGDKDKIYSLAEESYFARAYSDSTAPGGYVHSGGLLLIDKNKHIRGVYDGTDPKETERLKIDIKTLLNEQF